MKAIGITRTALLVLLFGVSGLAHARQEPQNDKQQNPEQKQSKQEQAKPEQQHAQQQQGQEKQQQHAQQQQQQQNKATQQQQHAQQQNENMQKEQHAQQQQQNQEKKSQQAQQQRVNAQPTQQQHHVEQTAWQQHRAQSWQSDHRTWQQRGGYHGYRIPDDRYRGYFGPSHGFRIYGLPFLVVGGYPRFQYEGYWFSTIDPWPEYWADDWYDTDDVYVTYVDSGYYLFNRRYPNVGIAVSISM